MLATTAAAKKAAALASLSNADADALLTQASDAAARLCRIAEAEGQPPTFARTRLDETVRLRAARRTLRLSRRPAALIALSIDDEPLDLAQVVVSSGRIVSFAAGADYGGFDAGARIFATYDAGYVTAVQKAQTPPPTGPDLPTDVERAVVLIAQHFFGLQNRAQFDVSARVEEDSDLGRIETRYFSADRGGGVPADAAFLLAPYCEFG